MLVIQIKWHRNHVVKLMRSDIKVSLQSRSRDGKKVSVSLLMVLVLVSVSWITDFDLMADFVHFLKFHLNLPACNCLQFYTCYFPNLSRRRTDVVLQAKNAERMSATLLKDLVFLNCNDVLQFEKKIFLQ